LLGTLLAAAFVAVVVWLVASWGWLDPGNSTAITWIVLVALSVILADRAVLVARAPSPHGPGGRRRGRFALSPSAARVTNCAVVARDERCDTRSPDAAPSSRARSIFS
jgi:hypothetical protein